MELYTDTSYALSKSLTRRYSTSFSQSSLLLPKRVRKHIYAIYGLVRCADEIVDTYQGANAADLLNGLEKEVMAAIKTGFSPNPIVHAFITTVRHCSIPTALIKPFFASMRMDLHQQVFTKERYEKYIYGSAEVIGLLCLKVFCADDTLTYERLSRGARALGSGYQKVNFLRDMAADYTERGRVYFPSVNYETFTDTQKSTIIKDIQRDFKLAKQSIDKLPADTQKAISVSYEYYLALLRKLKASPVETIQAGRIRIPDAQKFVLFSKEIIKRRTS